MNNCISPYILVMYYHNISNKIVHKRPLELKFHLQTLGTFYWDDFGDLGYIFQIHNQKLALHIIPTIRDYRLQWQPWITVMTLPLDASNNVNIYIHKNIQPYKQLTIYWCTHDRHKIQRLNKKRYYAVRAHIDWCKRKLTSLFKPSLFPRLK